MIKGIYSAAAGMSSEMLKTDILADNIANVNTIGYKSSGVTFKSFSEMLIDKIKGNSGQPIGTISQGSELQASVNDFTQGDIVITGNPLDVSIKGDGFFAVSPKNPEQGIAYTRAGNFSRNAQGFITTQTGDLVQGQAGPIQIPKGAKSIVINAQGDVTVDNATVGKLKVVEFADPKQLTRLGNSLFTTEQSPKVEPNGSTIQQGSIERSNVNILTQMVNNIMGHRHYDLMQKTISMQNETLNKAVTEIGKY